MGRPTVKSLFELLERQGRRCALSGRALTVENCSIDHKQPRCDGGNSESGNIQLVTEQINQAKGSMSNEEFIQLCCDVARHQRQKSKASEVRAEVGLTSIVMPDQKVMFS